MPWMSGAAFNGDMASVTFGFSAQSDEARHMTLGMEVIKFLLQQDPDNVPLIQKWIDKWFWRGYRLLALVGAMMDYMLPKRVMSWAEAWGIYFEQNGGALFADLARYGIRLPKYWEVTVKEKHRISHELWGILYQYRHAGGFSLWLPSEEEMDWFSAKYPDTFDKFHRPRLEYWRALEAKGTPFVNSNLPQLCQTCQWPLLFSEPDDPTQTCYRETEYQGEKFHFCSDGCKDIFCDEPEKYVNAWLPVHQIYQGNCLCDGADQASPEFNLLGEALKYMGIKPGIDGGDLRSSVDARNWERWTERPHNIHDKRGMVPTAVAEPQP
jgi:phenol hydroxylase P3 protein